MRLKIMLMALAFYSAPLFAVENLESPTPSDRGPINRENLLNEIKKFGDKLKEEAENAVNNKNLIQQIYDARFKNASGFEKSCLEAVNTHLLEKEDALVLEDQEHNLGRLNDMIDMMKYCLGEEFRGHLDQPVQNLLERMQQRYSGEYKDLTQFIAFGFADLISEIESKFGKDKLGDPKINKASLGLVWVSYLCALRHVMDSFGEPQ